MEQSNANEIKAILNISLDAKKTKLGNGREDSNTDTLSFNKHKTENSG